MFRDLTVFAEPQEKVACGLAYELTITKNHDNAVLKLGADAGDCSAANAKTVINAIDWFVPHYTPSVEHQAKISKQTFV